MGFTQNLPFHYQDGTKMYVFLSLSTLYLVSSITLLRAKC